MGLSCGMTMIKYILFVFNLLCALCGVALLVIGIIYIIDLNDFNKLTDGLNIEAIAGITIALGAVILIIAFLGCCGAIRDSYCMVLTYSIILFLLLVAKIVIVIIVLVKREDVQNEVDRVFQRLWNERQNDASVQEFINTVQQSLSCCGFEGPADYSAVGLPSSCCSGSPTVCTTNNAFTNGCRTEINNWIETASAVIAFVVLGVAAIVLLALIFSCCLANSIRREQRAHV